MAWALGTHIFPSLYDAGWQLPCIPTDAEEWRPCGEHHSDDAGRRSLKGSWSQELKGKVSSTNTAVAGRCGRRIGESVQGTAVQQAWQRLPRCLVMGSLSARMKETPWGLVPKTPTEDVYKGCKARSCVESMWVAISTPKKLGSTEIVWHNRSECLDSKQVEVFGPPCGEYEIKISWMKAFQFTKEFLVTLVFKARQLGHLRGEIVLGCIYTLIVL